MVALKFLDKPKNLHQIIKLKNAIVEVGYILS